MGSVSLCRYNAMAWRIVPMGVTRLFVNQSKFFLYFFLSILFYIHLQMTAIIGAMEMTGSVATMATVFQSSGCVTGRMTAWIGVMRTNARRK